MNSFEIALTGGSIPKEECWIPWVAMIRGLKDGEPVREFVKPRIDYKEANSKGTRGVYGYFLIEHERLYEVYEKTSWRGHRRYFVCLDEIGELYELTEEQVNECLESMA